MKLLTAQDIAERAQISISHAYELMAQIGVKLGRSVRVREDRFEAWILDNEASSTAPSKSAPGRSHATVAPIRPIAPSKRK